jgi:hypothetical protein
MTTAVVICALVTAAVNLLAAALGGWYWYRVAPVGDHQAPTRAFWVVLRSGQAAAVTLALLTGVLAATGHQPADQLFYLYALLPVAIGVVGEQLRVTSAESVLAARGLESASEVGALADSEQRALVVAIVRREVGVLALAAFVVCFLGLRAAATAHGL